MRDIFDGLTFFVEFGDPKKAIRTLGLIRNHGGTSRGNPVSVNYILVGDHASTRRIFDVPKDVYGPTDSYKTWRTTELICKFGKIVNDSGEVVTEGQRGSSVISKDWVQACVGVGELVPTESFQVSGRRMKRDVSPVTALYPSRLGRPFFTLRHSLDHLSTSLDNTPRLPQADQPRQSRDIPHTGGPTEVVEPVSRSSRPADSTSMGQRHNSQADPRVRPLAGPFLYTPPPRNTRILDQSRDPRLQSGLMEYRIDREKETNVEKEKEDRDYDRDYYVRPEYRRSRIVSSPRQQSSVSVHPASPRSTTPLPLEANRLSASTTAGGKSPTFDRRAREGIIDMKQTERRAKYGNTFLPTDHSTQHATEPLEANTPSYVPPSRIPEIDNRLRDGYDIAARQQRPLRIDTHLEMPRAVSQFQPPTPPESAVNNSAPRLLKRKISSAQGQQPVESGNRRPKVDNTERESGSTGRSQLFVVFGVSMTFHVSCEAALGRKIERLIQDGAGKPVPLDQATYIVVDSNSGSNLTEWTRRSEKTALPQLLVSYEWIERCALRGEMVDPREYRVNLQSSADANSEISGDGSRRNDWYDEWDLDSDNANDDEYGLYDLRSDTDSIELASKGSSSRRMPFGNPGPKKKEDLLGDAFAVEQDNDSEPDIPLAIAKRRSEVLTNWPHAPITGPRHGSLKDIAKEDLEQYEIFCRALRTWWKAGDYAGGVRGLCTWMDVKRPGNLSYRRLHEKYIEQFGRDVPELPYRPKVRSK